MNDFKVMVRLLLAIQKSEENPPFTSALVSEKALRTTSRKRALLAIKLQNAGYIEGLITTEDIDNAPVEVLWSNSKPAITLEGLEYMATNKPLNKAVKEMKEIGTDIAAKTIRAQIYQTF